MSLVDRQGPRSARPPEGRGPHGAFPPTAAGELRSELDTKLIVTDSVWIYEELWMELRRRNKFEFGFTNKFMSQAS